MDKNQNLTSFQELTTTELNQITGGGWWENFLYSVNRYSHNITQGLLISQYNYKKIRSRYKNSRSYFHHSVCIIVSI